MYRKPNNEMTDHTDNSYKKNQIGRRFSKIFDVLLNPGYYEGTKYANYFNRLNDDGKSKIYVYDSLEEELQKLIDSPKSQMKYLVGLAGMGKTTLIRNFFKIIDRDIKITDDSIIIYISFYYANLSFDMPQKSIDNEVIRYLIRTVKKLMSNVFLSSQEEKTAFWRGFYNFIDDSKPTLLENEDITPDTLLESELSDLNDIYIYEKNQLDYVCKEKTLEYYSMLIKYILKREDSDKNIVFIYDDVESKEEIFHKRLIETARHIHSCFSATEGRELNIKTIVTLRAYTFRCHIDRQSAARRECIQNDTILKKKSVSLHDIFERRFSEIEEIEKTKQLSKKLEGYNDAKRQLYYVEQQLNNIGSQLIYNIANYNICDAMVIYCNVMTNAEWIACNEQETNGAFRLDAEKYRLTTENILHAIANDNLKGYIEKDNSYIPNILCNSKDSSSLVRLYIIRYMLMSKTTEVYGVKYLEGKEILIDIMNLFVRPTDNSDRREYWQALVNDSLEHLYRTGILFRSLYDVENADCSQIERKYDNSYKLYLSPKGKCLYNLFSQNAVLLELFRDDIYTDLPNNDKLTVQLGAYDTFDYLIKYLKTCFTEEQKNIASAIYNIQKYHEIIGGEFITSSLLSGVVKNVNVYYKNKGEEYSSLVGEAKDLCKVMINYYDELLKRYSIKFCISDYLEQFTNLNNEQ